MLDLWFLFTIFYPNVKTLILGELEGANAIKALMIVGVMTLHSFAEGIGVGVYFGGGEILDSLITTYTVIPITISFTAMLAFQHYSMAK